MATMFQVDILGEQQISRMLEGVEYRGQDLRPVWDHFVADWNRFMRHQFDSQGGQGRTWPPLSPAYAEWKAKHYPGQPILVREGRLRESLTGSTADTIDEREQDYFRIGTAVEYAAYHQAGTRKMPPRPPMVIPDEAKDRWVRAIHEFLVTGTVETAFAYRGF